MAAIPGSTSELIAGRRYKLYNFVYSPSGTVILFRRRVRSVDDFPLELGSMKKHAGTLDATPSKRSFLAIIADYDLKRSICELVDNGLDVWVRDDRSRHITIEILLDGDQQTIRVKDNAGGVPEAELEYLVGPGQTGSKPTDETIGLFGVGVKRA